MGKLSSNILDDLGVYNYNSSDKGKKEVGESEKKT